VGDGIPNNSKYDCWQLAVSVMVYALKHNSNTDKCTYRLSFSKDNTADAQLWTYLEATRENALPPFKSLASIFNVSALTLAISVSCAKK